ncbi:MAG: hypothetical protein CL844_09860 [Crocinitomicaceae bacterium]|nr:hypothetical protein [Crocinitomicaceae bacterium]|tara:strand:+ start:56650 stop:59469 length:2820 start_codon:yes stop_codon:yes gene_type:complete
MNFISRVANYIFEQDLDLDNLTIVLPSERAKKYLSSALFKVYGRPIISPKIFTIDNWIKHHSRETVIDNTRALVRLFEIHLDQFQATHECTFDEFLTWGNIILNDFNEIDRYLLDSNQVFKNLSDIKELESWSFGDTEVTENQSRFMEFWERLPTYYNLLNQSLLDKKACYFGKSFKFLSENIHHLFKENKDKQFLFAGLNALSKSEMSIIKQLERIGKAHVIIDADDYYFNKKSHEAGRFLRELLGFLDKQSIDFIQDEISNKKMNVEIFDCVQITGQVKVASTILQDLPKDEVDQTMILLADESLVGPLLKNLPANIKKANITLGLPIRNTAVKTWVEIIFSIQENKSRFNTNAFYYNDLLNLFNHPFIISILNEEEKKKIVNIEQSILKNNRIFLNYKNLEISSFLKKILNLISSDWLSDWNKAIFYIRDLNKYIFSSLREEFSFEKAIIESFDYSLIDFQNIIYEGLPEMTLKSFNNLFSQHWDKKSIAYHGNPMDGLQIMGLLETRCLDFKRIICIGMNEGKLPLNNSIQSIIPMDLRQHYGLPTIRERQGLFAHHFYRLLHFCSDIYITYCSSTDSIGINEPSRYLMQIEMELNHLNKKIKIQKKTYSLDVEKSVVLTNIIKTPEIKKRLDFIISNSVSASMLKKYLMCSLDFYFRYVMEFGESNSVEEEVENATFGTIIHETLQELYYPFARYDKNGLERIPNPKNITISNIKEMLNKYKEIIHKKFINHFNGDSDSFTKGKNLLSYRMAIEMTERFLNSEIKFLSQQKELVFIESVEKEYNASISIHVNGESKTINLRGFVDRVDRVGDQVRIIDYKSGKVLNNDVALRDKDKSAEDIVETIKKRKHVLQLLQYAFLYKKNHNVIPQSSIISFVSNQGEPFILNVKKNDLEMVVSNFPRYLGIIFSEMYNDEIPFSHVEENGEFSYCEYCD